VPIFSTDTGDIISALVIGSNRSTRGQGCERGNEKRHLGEWPTIFAPPFEIRAAALNDKIAIADKVDRMQNNFL